MSLTRVMHVRTRSTIGLAHRLHFPGRTKCIGKCGSHAVSRPSSLVHLRAFTCLIVQHRSAYRALSLFDASMHTHVLKDRPLPCPSLPSCPPFARRFVKLGGNVRMQPRALRQGVIESDRLRSGYETRPRF